MGVFRKQGVYCIDYYVNGRRKRERIGPDRRLAETVHRKRKVEIAEGKFLDKRRPITTTFDELAREFLPYAHANKRSWIRDEVSIRILTEVFGGKRLTEITDVFVSSCRHVGLGDFRFHDFRHTAVTNHRRSGIVALTAMKITGHKTMAAFKRYHTIDEDDLPATQRRMDTYLDTKGKMRREHLN